jgi:hypothetical protein
MVRDNSVLFETSLNRKAPIADVKILCKSGNHYARLKVW